MASWQIPGPISASSRSGSAPSLDISQPAQQHAHIPSWMEQIMRALDRLEIGQQHNRESSETRVAALRDHMDSRIDDLRQDVSGRMDRMETRLMTVEQATREQPEPAPVAQPSTPHATPPPSAPLPWYREMTTREWLFWAVLLMTGTGIVKVEALERLARLPIATVITSGPVAK